MKKIVALLLTLVLSLSVISALATSVIGGETVTVKDGVLLTYGETTYQSVDLAAKPYRNVKLGDPAPVANKAILESLTAQVTDSVVKSYEVSGMDADGNLTGTPTIIEYNGKKAELIVVTIMVEYEDGTIRYERWNYVRVEGETEYVVVSCSISVA